MSFVRWATRPPANEPVLIAAFEGWNDAGDAATTAVRHLRDAWGATAFAEIDAEEFYDFTESRPSIERVAGEARIRWPSNRFSAADPVGAPSVVLLRGQEPQLRWRTFCDQIIEVATATNARLVVTLGALLAEVPHTRPTPVYGTADDPAVAEALHLEASSYEGPTGIVGVLHDRCREAGLNSASLWAAVPSYVPAAPSPKAALSIVERVCDLLGASVDTAPLADDARSYESQITALASEDDDTATYVTQLEEAYDRDALAGLTGDRLVSEVEQFLRNL